jgi:UDP-glucose 4-epimerase
MTSGPAVVVTGANGRIGRHVVTHLVESGYDVIGLDVHPEPVVEHGRYLSRRLEEIAAADLAGVGAVVHLGAVQSWDDGRRDDIFSANVRGTYRLLEAAVASGSVRRVVFASSGEVYPETNPQFQPIDESHPRLPTSFYGMTKVLGEEMLGFYARRHGLEAVVARLCHVQDPVDMLDPTATAEGPRRFLLRQRLEQERRRDPESAATRALSALDDGTDRLLVIERADGGRVRMGILAPQDIAVGLRLAMELPAAVGQTFGLGPDESIDLAEFTRRLGEAADLPVVTATLDSPEVDYWTLNARARELLGFRPEVGYDGLVERAARARERRRAGRATPGLDTRS